MEPSYPTDFQKKMLWRALTGVCLFVITALFVTFIWIVSEVLGYLQPVLIPLAVAGIIAYLLDPVVTWIQTRGLNRLRAVLSVFGSFVAAVLLFGAIAGPPIVQQIGEAVSDRQEIGNSIGKKLKDMQEVSWVSPLAKYLSEPAVENAGSPPQTPATGSNSNVPFEETRFGVMLSKNTGKIATAITSFLSKSTGKIIGYIGLLLGFIMIPIYLYYFLTESASIKENWHLYVPLKASKFKTEVVSTLNEINGYLIAFFRGQVLVAFIDGILVGLTLAIFGLPYGLVIGVLMAILGVIPFVGNLICLIPACIIAFVHFSVAENQHYLGDSPWAYVGAVIAIFLIVQQINSLITAPKIVGDSVGLHPMTVIFSMLFWSLILGGFIGALLAVPMTAAVKVIFVRYLWDAKIMDDQESEPNDPPDSAEGENLATT